MTSDFLYPIAVSGSAITTFCTPYLIKYSDPAADRIEAALPEKWRIALAHYARNTVAVSSTSEWSKLVRNYMSGVFIFGILVAAIFLLVDRLALLFTLNIDERLREALTYVVALGLSAPFLWAMAIRRPQADLVESVWTNHRARVPLVFIESLRVILASALIGILSAELLNLNSLLTASIALCAILIFAFSRNLNSLYQLIEKRFVTNLSERETVATEAAPLLAPWDAHVVWLDVPPNSSIVGLTLGELNVRSRFGVTIAATERGTRRLVAPSPSERIYPHDRLAALGNDEQLTSFRKHIETERANGGDEFNSTHYALRQVELRGTSPLIGRSVRDAEIRTLTKGLLVGIERNGERMLNPDSSTIFESGDHVWIVGEPTRFVASPISR